MGQFNPVGIGLIAVPILLSLTLHEYGHARVALAFGDDTAKRAGRITLNPLAHLDLMGTLCMLFGPVGWAKPVPVTTANLRPPGKADICVSLAGAGMNLMLILVSSSVLTIMSLAGVRVDAEGAVTVAAVAAFIMAFLIRINIALIVFNLIPLYPLDGHHVLREILPVRTHGGFMHWQRTFGRPVLLAMLLLPWLLRLLGTGVYFNPLGRLIWGVIEPVTKLALPGPALQLARNAWYQLAPFLPYATP